MTVLPAAQLRSKIDSNNDDLSSDLDALPKVEGNTQRKLKETSSKSTFNEENLAQIVFKDSKSLKIRIPSSQIPCCSRCGSKTEIVNGANFVTDGPYQTNTRPFTLWHCDYCRNYEITKPSLFLLLKRIVGYRKGSDVSFKIERRPTFTRHGKISIIDNSSNCICYIPVKNHL